MRVKIWIWCVIVLLFSINCFADSSKKDEVINTKLMSEDDNLLAELIANEYPRITFYNNYCNFYKSHSISSIDMDDVEFMGNLSLSFYYAQFVSRSALSGLQYIKKEAILNHYKKTGIFPFGVSSDFTILDDKGNSCTGVCIQPIDQAKERKVDLNENKQKLLYDGKYVFCYDGKYLFYVDDEDLLEKFKPDINNLDMKNKNDYIKMVYRLNGYSYIFSNESPCKMSIEKDLPQFQIYTLKELPQFQMYTLCIGKDTKGYFMGFALYYNTEEEAEKDVRLIDQWIREKILFTIPGKNLSDFFVMEKEFVFRENNVLYGKIYQINSNHGLSFWKDTVLKKDYLF